MFNTALEQFVTLWAVIDPIGTLPVFIAVTAGLTAAQQRKTALKATLVSGGILLAFIAAGQFVLDGLGISLIAFQIAGGLILFLFALTMIFGESKPQSEVESTSAQADIAVFPLAMPSLASPGAMLAVVVLTDNNRHSLEEQAVTAAMMLLVVAAALVVMLLASPLNRLLGMAGAAIISRVMGMMLAAVAVDNVLEAFTKLGVLPPI
jgi:multiple antibiotic resistance protein